MTINTQFKIFRGVVAFLTVAVFAPFVRNLLVKMAMLLPRFASCLAIGAVVYTILVGGTVLAAKLGDHANIKQQYFGDGFSSGFWIGNIPIALAIGIGITLICDLQGTALYIYSCTLNPDRYARLDEAIELASELVAFALYIAFEIVDEKDYREAGANYNSWSKIYHDIANYAGQLYLAVYIVFALLCAFGTIGIKVELFMLVAGGVVGWIIAYNWCRYHPQATDKPDYAKIHGKANGVDNTDD